MVSNQFEPEHMKKWTLPANYLGEHWPEYYVFLGQHRDSDTLTRSNFRCGLDAIGGESETVQVVRESHWAVGWVEWIAIHESDEVALRKADEIVAALEDYPVVSDDDLSELEDTEYREQWDNCGWMDFVIALSEKFDIEWDSFEYETLENQPIEQLLEFFESLIPSGDYWIPYSDGISIRTDIAVRNCTREQLDAFLEGQAKLKRIFPA